MKGRVLVADDDVSIKNLVEMYLTSEGYEVVSVENGEEVLKEVSKTSFDLIILDVMMPKLDGVTTCLKLREGNHHMPIIFLSAKGDEIHKIQGLTVGGDDYISKPFGAMELIARVKAQLRRFKQFNNNAMVNNIIQIDELEIDIDSRAVKLRGEGIKLTPKEFDILKCMAQNRGVVFTLENLYEKVWKEKFVVSDTSIVVHITNLRQKLERDPKNPEYIKTVWGVGYKI